MSQSYWDPGHERDDLIAIALGERPADLAIRGGRLVDVHTGEIYLADVAVAGSRIAAVGDVERCVGPSTRTVDATGHYLLPGFIETHFHVGASALAMTELARLLVPRGTAAIVTDFYEPAAMAGVEAMRFLLDETALTPLKVFFSPFCPSYADGHRIPPEEFEAVLDWPECAEVREWWLAREHNGHPAEAAIGRKARASGIRLSGHLAGADGPALQACVAAGVHSDHEADTAQEALARARLGVAMQMRFSSGSREDMANVLKAITEHGCDSRMFMFSTDEEDVDELADLGHIDHRVREAVAAGVAPVDAIRMGSLNAATYLGVTGDLGSVTPGRLAFVTVVDDLARFTVKTVVAGPQVVGEDGRYAGAEPEPVTYPASFHDTIKLARPLKATDFAIPAAGPTVTARVISADGWQELQHELPTAEGHVQPALDRDIVKVAVIERHEATGKVGVGLLQGFGLQRGAFGTAFHPVAMNLGIVGANDADMAVVANRIAELQGGFVAALDGEVIAEVALPLLGYLSSEPAERVVEEFRTVRATIAERLGCTVPGLYTTLGFLLLPVSPGLHIVADGLVRVEYGERTERTPVPVIVE